MGYVSIRLGKPWIYKLIMDKMVYLSLRSPVFTHPIIKGQVRHVIDVNLSQVDLLTLAPNDGL